MDQNQIRKLKIPIQLYLTPPHLHAYAKLQPSLLHISFNLNYSINHHK
jgi:hypothetical protein